MNPVWPSQTSISFCLGFHVVGIVQHAMALTGPTGARTAMQLTVLCTSLYQHLNKQGPLEHHTSLPPGHHGAAMKASHINRILPCSTFPACVVHPPTSAPIASHPVPTSSSKLTTSKPLTTSNICLSPPNAPPRLQRLAKVEKPTSKPVQQLSSTPAGRPKSSAHGTAFSMPVAASHNYASRPHSVKPDGPGVSVVASHLLMTGASGAQPAKLSDQGSANFSNLQPNLATAATATASATATVEPQISKQAVHVTAQSYVMAATLQCRPPVNISSSAKVPSSTQSRVTLVSKQQTAQHAQHKKDEVSLKVPCMAGDSHNPDHSGPQGGNAPAGVQQQVSNTLGHQNLLRVTKEAPDVTVDNHNQLTQPAVKQQASDRHAGDNVPLEHVHTDSKEQVTNKLASLHDQSVNQPLPQQQAHALEQSVPSHLMPEICNSSDYGAMVWAVNKALILALDWLGSSEESCMALQSAVDKLEGEHLLGFVNRRYQWIRSSYARGEKVRLRQLLKDTLGVDV